MADRIEEALRTLGKTAAIAGRGSPVRADVMAIATLRAEIARLRDALRAQERIGYDKAREQAARIRPGCASPATLRAAIRAMEPEA